MKVSILTKDGTAIVLTGDKLIQILQNFLGFGFDEEQILSITVLKINI